jgi:hypothetical protein
MAFKVKKCGKYKSLVLGNGAPLEFALSGCVVTRPPYLANSKWYARFDVSGAEGRDVLSTVESEIFRLAKPRYSPARFMANVVTKLDLDSVEFPGELVPGQAVDLVVAPGPFGDFGWCLNVRRVLVAGACLQ